MISLTLTVSAMTVEYWFSINGYVVKPCQGLKLTLMILPFTIPIVISRIFCFGIIMATPKIWWLKLALLLMMVIFYSLCYGIVLIHIRDKYEDKIVKNVIYVILQCVTSFFAPCVWINPKVKLLYFVSIGQVSHQH